MKKIFSIKNVLLGILFILIDFSVYIFFGLMILQYEDFYDESKGAYWSLKSMTNIQKVSYIGYYIWMFINVFLIIFIIYRVFKNLTNKQNHN